MVDELSCYHVTLSPWKVCAPWRGYLMVELMGTIAVQDVRHCKGSELNCLDHYAPQTTKASGATATYPVHE